jgi:hypothetical protein
VDGAASSKAWKTGQVHPIVDEFYIELYIFNCVTKSNKNVDNLKLEVNIPEINLKIVDTQVAFFIQFKDKALETMAEKMPKNELEESEEPPIKETKTK